MAKTGRSRSSAERRTSSSWASRGRLGRWVWGAGALAIDAGINVAAAGEEEGIKTLQRMFWVDQDGFRAGLAQAIQVVLCALSATGAPARYSHSAKHLTSNSNPEKEQTLEFGLANETAAHPVQSKGVGGRRRRRARTEA